MLEAGLPITKAMKLAGKELSGRLAKSFGSIAEELAQGNNLTDAIKQRSDVFPTMDIMAIEAAERSGDLDRVVKLLADWYELRHRVGGLIKSQLVLPVIIFHAMAFIAPLPKCFISNFNFTTYPGDLIAILSVFYIPTIIIYLIVRFTPQRGPLRKLFDSTILRIPVLGPGLRHAAYSRFSRTFYILYKSGIAPYECVEKGCAATGNTVISGLLVGGVRSARQGNPISEGFSKELPEDFSNLWQVGEESGSLDKVSLKLAETHGYVAERYLTEFGRWFPRLVYILVCIYLIIKIVQNFGQAYGSVLNL